MQYWMLVPKKIMKLLILNKVGAVEYTLAQQQLDLKILSFFDASINMDNSPYFRNYLPTMLITVNSHYYRIGTIVKSIEKYPSLWLGGDALCTIRYDLFW